MIISMPSHLGVIFREYVHINGFRINAALELQGQVVDVIATNSGLVNACRKDILAVC